MADFLYVCAFSNGSVKVGRSNDPDTRIAQHEDRVACLGVLLSERFTIECAGPSPHAEAELIQRCVERASKRHKYEWFDGLDFPDVCDWAGEFAAVVPHAEVARMDDGRIDFRSVIRVLSLAGVSQIVMAARCRCAQPSISDISTGRTKEPTYSIGAELLRMVDEVSATQPTLV